MKSIRDYIRLLKTSLSDTPWYITVYYVSLLLMLASIPLSKFTTSVFELVLAGSWLVIGAVQYPKPIINGRSVLGIVASFLRNAILALVDNFRKLFANKTALLLISIYLMLVVGMLWTKDIGSGIYVLRTQLPLLILPILFATGPKIGERFLKVLIIGYLLSVFGGSIYRFILFLSLDVREPRLIDPHTSHIRFSLSVAFAIFSNIYLILFDRESLGKILKVILMAICIWLILFVVYMHYSTGITLIFIILPLAVVIRAIFINPSWKVRISGGIVIIIITAFLIGYISNISDKNLKTERVYFYKLEKRTASGNIYWHDTINFGVENGKYSGLYICEPELKKEWSKRSSLTYTGSDKKNQRLRSTIIRYMASLDLRKDSVGMAKLSNNDIINIENGIVNVKTIKGFNITGQIEQLMKGYRNYKKSGNANDHTLMQRYEYWKTGLAIVKQNPLFGVGTGDIRNAYDKQYIIEKTKLRPENRLRSHNQYITILVALGTVGLLWFLTAIIILIVRQKMFRNFYFFVFLIIFLVSCLTEDTLDSQEGATFFAAFMSLFLLGILNSRNRKSTDEN